MSRSLYERGFSVGSAGNISAAVDDVILMTPTNSCLGFLDSAKISKVTRDGRHLSGDRPSKEIFLHKAFYETRPQTGAVVHLHSTYATALSCFTDIDPDDCIPPLTPYVVMRVGQVKLLEYVRPGDEKAGDLIRALGGNMLQCFSQITARSSPAKIFPRPSMRRKNWKKPRNCSLCCVACQRGCCRMKTWLSSSPFSARISPSAFQRRRP